MGGGARSEARSQRRQQRTLDAMNAESAARLKKKKKEQALIDAGRGKARIASAGRRRTVFTSFLGLGDEGSDSLS